MFRTADPSYGGKNLQPPDVEWVAQVSLLRPGFLLANGFQPEHPGLKSETWATHSIFFRASFTFLGGPQAMSTPVGMQFYCDCKHFSQKALRARQISLASQVVHHGSLCLRLFSERTADNCQQMDITDGFL
jgi:hypothetical protein